MKLFTKLSLTSILLLTICTSSLAQEKSLRAGVWGDQLDGTYKNPIINADYSDPDVIRVGKCFYMVCSDFHFMGMPILRSTDLVNWQIISQVYHRLDIDPKYSTMEKYGNGSWAPSLRYHNNRFYVYFCTPDEGLYMSSTIDPAGDWAPLTEVKRVRGWEDPCPFWDDNGQAYLGHSVLGAGPIIIHKMSADGKHLLDDGKTVYQGPVSEGTKIYKRDNRYYIIIPEGGVGTGYQTALRADNIYGPYERKIVLEQGSTKINGPHQGGLVETEAGEAWFIHFHDSGSIGRVTMLEPVHWQDGWPLMGVDLDKNGIGEPVTQYTKPKIENPGKINLIQTSDEFNTTKLGLQWQWNHNPEDRSWSLKSNKGYLALTALKAPDIKNARNTITQKLMGKTGEITTALNCTKLAAGQRAGLCLLGNYMHEVGVLKGDSGMVVYANNNGHLITEPLLKQSVIYLRVNVDIEHDHTTLSYSLDGKLFTAIGEVCKLSDFNFWKAVRPALFSFNPERDGGVALFDWFRYGFDGTGGEIGR